MEHYISLYINMDKVKNLKTGRNVLIKRNKQKILNNPLDFEIPTGLVLIKDRNDRIKLIPQTRAKRFIKSANDILPINRHIMFNPQTGNVVTRNERNIKKLEQYTAKQTLQTANPSIPGLRKLLRQFIGKMVNIRYIVDGNTIVEEVYNMPKTFSSWWNKNINISSPWIVESDKNVFMANNGNGRLYAYEYNNVDLPNKQILQKFRNGIDHCMLQPIKNWILDTIETAKSKPTKKKYNEKLDLINEYIAKYDNGYPQEQITDLCNDFQIDINVAIPVGNKHFVEGKSMKKALTKFNFINTQINHVDFKATQKIKAIKLSQDELNAKFKELKKHDVFMTYNSHKGNIIYINTLEQCYAIKTEYGELFNQFEKDNGMNNYKICDIKQPVLSKFIKEGTHYNGTYDLKNTEYLNCENYEHIDMEKAYTQFKRCDYYEGFLGKITDFRQTDKIEGVGLYMITDLWWRNANLKLKQLNEKLGMYINGGIYPSCELKFLTDNGVKYTIVGGCWGVKSFDFTFSKEMFKEVDKVKNFSRWTGRCDQHELHSVIKIQAEREYASVLKQYVTEDTQVWYDDEQNEILIKYPKKTNEHLTHITSFITAYQRLQILKQLMKMDMSKLVRICVDGIYYEQHECEIDAVYRDDKKKTFRNPPCEKFISVEPFEYKHKIPKARNHNAKELWIGEGGCGKTYVNLIDRGLIKTCFLAPSWKLSRNKEEEFKCNVSVWAKAITKDTETIKFFKSAYNVLIFDEVSMMTEGQKQQIFDLYGDEMKLIFCGDIGYQLAPFDNEEMNSDGFDIVVLGGKSRRCKCEKLREILDYMRDNIDTNIKYDIIDFMWRHGRIVDETEMNYNIEDMILTATHVHKDYYTEKYSHLEKWYVTSNSRQYQNGQIIIGDKPVGVTCENRHAYTTHSIQGETANNKLFIDIMKMNNPRMVYTAISRARRLDQIYIINLTKEVREMLKEEQKRKSGL